MGKERVEESPWHAPRVRDEEPGSRSGHRLLGRDRVESLLAQILEEQRKTNQLLLMLIEAMGQEEADPDDEPVTYMDGTKVS